MDDIELQNLLKRLGKAILILLVFTSLFMVAMQIKFGSEDTKALKIVRNKKDAIILLRKTKCEKCKEIKQELKNQNIKYEEIKTDTENYYKTFLKELNISENDILEPTILYIKEGQVISIYVDINSITDLREYLSNIE